MTLAFAWAAYPFTQYASNSNTNDAIMPAFLIWGFWLCTSPWARGVFAAFAGWTKFAALLVAPLWATYPEFRGSRRTGAALRRRPSRWRPQPASGCCCSSRARSTPRACSGTGRSRPRSTATRRSRSGTGGSTTPGLPDLTGSSRCSRALLVVGAVAVAFLPRRKSPLQLAALTGAILIGFELVLTHWFYLYLPWFFAFAAYAVLAAEPARRRRRSRSAMSTSSESWSRQA